MCMHKFYTLDSYLPSDIPFLLLVFDVAALKYSYCFMVKNRPFFLRASSYTAAPV